MNEEQTKEIVDAIVRKPGQNADDVDIEDVEEAMFKYLNYASVLMAMLGLSQHWAALTEIKAHARDELEIRRNRRKSREND